MLLNDKVVVVSGVGPGLGRSVALEAAGEGARVVCVARTKSFVEKVADEIVSSGGDALAVAADVTSPEDCQRVAVETRDRFGGIDGLVNSAFSIGSLSAFEDADMDEWRAAFEVNVFGTLELIRATLDLLRTDRGGAVVNVNTASALRPMKYQGAYGGSKAAMEFLTRQLAVELGPGGVRFNTVYCGPMAGPSLDRAIEYWAQERALSPEQVSTDIASTMATGRIPTDRDVAMVIAMLLSDKAAVMTGAAVHATGGFGLEQRI